MSNEIESKPRRESPCTVRLQEDAKAGWDLLCRDIEAECGGLIDKVTRNWALNVYLRVYPYLRERNKIRARDLKAVVSLSPPPMTSPRPPQS